MTSGCFFGESGLVYSMRLILIIMAVLVHQRLLVGGEPTNLLKPVADVKSWKFAQVAPATGSIKATEREIHFVTTEVDGTDWHVQGFQVDLNLEEGRTYRVKFKARSTGLRGYSLRAMIDTVDYHEIGLREELFASKHYREENITFTAIGVVEGKNRIGFVLGDEKGTLIIKDMTLTKE